MLLKRHHFLCISSARVTLHAACPHSPNISAAQRHRFILTGNKKRYLCPPLPQVDVEPRHSNSAGRKQYGGRDVTKTVYKERFLSCHFNAESSELLPFFCVFVLETWRRCCFPLLKPRWRINSCPWRACIARHTFGKRNCNCFALQAWFGRG